MPEGREYDGKVRINGRHFDNYIKPWMYREEIFRPFEVTNTLGLFDVVANVHGGGVSGQASVRFSLYSNLDQLRIAGEGVLKVCMETVCFARSQSIRQ